jgi:metal-responsive CopG/Arc/MetJ family transcriptional regulator
MAARSGTATMGRTVRAVRGRPVVNISLSTEALARLDAIAAERGQTRSGAVEQLVRNARLSNGKL